jgi:hypothetical protein
MNTIVTKKSISFNISYALPLIDLPSKKSHQLYKKKGFIISEVNLN